MIVIDTHVLVWWLTQHERLSPAARLALAQVNATNPAVLSAISILEITTAVRRGRMDLSVPIGDPADRIVAATAELLGARLVSADEKLRQHPAVQALW